MKLTGNSNDIFTQLAKQSPDALRALDKANQVNGTIKGRVLPYQALALYILAKSYNHKRILEIGTLIGFSTSMIAQAAPEAEIITLNPAMHEFAIAKENLKQYKNVTLKSLLSWDYIQEDTGNFDMVFVDGDHNRIAKDLPWWMKLNDNGLMLFHDYSPITSYKVYEAVNDFAAKLGKELDILIVDENKVGLAGLYKR